jgi:hypothetical protein
MKPEQIYERRESAGRMEAIMIVASVIGTIAAVAVLLNYGWLPALGLFLLSVIAFAMSRMFDLLGDILSSVGRVEESKKPGRSEKGDDVA